MVQVVIVEMIRRYAVKAMARVKPGCSFLEELVISFELNYLYFLLRLDTLISVINAGFLSWPIIRLNLNVLPTSSCF